MVLMVILEVVVVTVLMVAHIGTSERTKAYFSGADSSQQTADSRRYKQQIADSRRYRQHTADYRLQTV
jgi:ABC-type cobalt transport system substrate-binding protein